MQKKLVQQSTLIKQSVINHNKLATNSFTKKVKETERTNRKAEIESDAKKKLKLSKNSISFAKEIENEAHECISYRRL